MDVNRRMTNHTFKEPMLDRLRRSGVTYESHSSDRWCLNLEILDEGTCEKWVTLSTISQ